MSILQVESCPEGMLKKSSICENVMILIKSRYNTFSSSSISVYYTGCIKKKVIEIQRAIIRELLGVWTIGFHIRKVRLLAIEWHAFHAKWSMYEAELKMLVKIEYFHLCA
jgi:hypothetical protein